MGINKRRAEEEKEEAMAAMMLIPDDVLSQIFIRIHDCRSLLRCTAVCKAWFSIINSDHFRHQKQKRLSNNLQQSKPFTLLFRHGRVDKLTKPFPYQYFSKESQTLHQKNTNNTNIIHSQDDYYLNFLPWPEFRLLSVTNDLLLLSREMGKDFMICNPFTKQWIVIPKTPIDLTEVFDYSGHGGLICENKDDKLFRYRIMLVWRKVYGESYLSDFGQITFSSETGQWSSVKNITLPHDLSDEPPIVCNGMLHWLSLNYDTAIAHGIIALDPFHEDPNYYNYIQFPLAFPQDERQKRWVNIRLGLVQGRLRISLVTFLTRRKRIFSVKVWELNYDNNNGDDGKTTSWSLVHDFEKRGIPFKYKYVVVMAFHPTNDNVLFILFDNIHVYQYEIREEKMEKIYQFPDPGYLQFGIRVQNFPFVYPFWPTKIPTFPSLTVSALHHWMV
ncbi:hypothetical protein F8388_024203 [Cannabis sativa]|uniref:F-box domain-containing protein n=1 Tax=Cannabis sativa TaxID=3483 RepID=A0A7J6DYF8_CANSA|nr:hypothetical protein F8388_024203 [Cannabis sativa]